MAEPPRLDSLYRPGKLSLSWNPATGRLELSGDKDLVQKIESEIEQIKRDAPKQIEEDKKHAYAMQQLYKNNPEFRRLYDAACKKTKKLISL